MFLALHFSTASPTVWQNIATTVRLLLLTTVVTHLKIMVDNFITFFSCTLGESLTYSSLPFEVSGLLPDSYAAATNNAFSWTVSQIVDDDNVNKSKRSAFSINNKADTLYLRELPLVMPGDSLNLDITAKSSCDLETLCVNSIINSLMGAKCKDDGKNVDVLIESHPGLPLVLRRRLKGMAAKVKEGENMKSVW